MRFLLFAVLVVGCASGSPEKPSAHEDHTVVDAETPTKDQAQPMTDALPPDSGGACYPSQTRNVPECAGLELCVTSTPGIQVDPQNCGSGQCAWTLQPDDGDTLTYENDQGWIFLRFDAGSLDGVHDTAGLLAGFQHVNFYAKFPKRDLPSQPIYFDSRMGPTGLDVLEMKDGRVHVKVTFKIADPYLSLLSKTAFCGDSNSCSCSFDGYQADSSFEVDLPIQSNP